MRIEVNFGDRVLDLELPDEQVVGVWRGPVEGTRSGVDRDSFAAASRHREIFPRCARPSFRATA